MVTRSQIIFQRQAKVLQEAGVAIASSPAVAYVVVSIIHFGSKQYAPQSASTTAQTKESLLGFHFCVFVACSRVACYVGHSVGGHACMHPSSSLL